MSAAEAILKRVLSTRMGDSQATASTVAFLFVPVDSVFHSFLSRSDERFELASDLREPLQFILLKLQETVRPNFPKDRFLHIFQASHRVIVSPNPPSCHDKLERYSGRDPLLQRVSCPRE